MRFGTVLGVGIVALLTHPALADNFFVITGTFQSQAAAQISAAETGGWVLDTDAYNALAPGLFAVVRGPFRSAKAAQSQLSFITSGGGYAGAYVKAGGSPRLPQALATGPPAVLAAILGELLITVEEHPGASNPCEPQEPYESVSLSYMGVTRKHDAATDTYPPVAERVPIKMGTFSVIKRTGELDRMRACFE